MSEDKKNKQDIETERKSKAQPSTTAAAPQTTQPIHTPEIPQMQYMPQTPQMQQMPQIQQMPQTIYTPQMGPMYNYADYMPQVPLICCPYLMNIQCPMMQGEMHGAGYAGYMQGNPYGAMQQPQFMYGSGMYAPYTGGNNMNCMQY